MRARSFWTREAKTGPGSSGLGSRGAPIFGSMTALKFVVPTGFRLKSVLQAPDSNEFVSFRFMKWPDDVVNPRPRAPRPPTSSRRETNPDLLRPQCQGV